MLLIKTLTMRDSWTPFFYYEIIIITKTYYLVIMVLKNIVSFLLLFSGIYPND